MCRYVDILYIYIFLFFSWNCFSGIVFLIPPWSCCRDGALLHSGAEPGRRGGQSASGAGIGRLCRQGQIPISLVIRTQQIIPIIYIYP